MRTDHDISSQNDVGTFDLAVIGAGPGGLSAGARAANRGLSHIVLEAAEKHANTLQHYQRRKHVMAEPSILPLRSDIAFSAGPSVEFAHLASSRSSASRITM